MLRRKSLIAALSGAAALLAVAAASDIAPCPSDYGDLASAYVKTRLDDPIAARVQIVSEPYKVRTAINGRADLVGWAVDIRVRARQANGAPGEYLPYAVIFIDGEAVALCEDASDLVRV